MKDLENRKDLEDLLREFYTLATHDKLIGQHFSDLNLDTHLPVIIDFWDKILFGNPVYFGNPLFVHYELHRKTKLLPDHFKRWKHIFDETMDRMFAGDTAELAKSRAEVIAGSLSMRLNDETSVYTQIDNK